MAEKNNRFNDESEKKRQPKRSARGERHAAAKEKNAADRRVVSYEDVPIDKYDEPTPYKKAFKGIADNFCVCNFASCHT